MKGRRRAGSVFLVLVIVFAAAGTAGYLAYRSLVTELAVSTSSDLVVQSVSAIVGDCMAEGLGDGLVTLDRRADNTVAAVSTNVAAVNTLAAEILSRAVAATAENDLHVNVPLGSFFGVPVFSVPVSVKMLSSSSYDFRSELESAGINQTRHRVILVLRVDAALFMPWRVVYTSSEAEILVSDTVVVGDVPQSYLNWENEG